MDYMSEYKSKLGTPEQAAALVKSGDWVEYGTGVAFPKLCDEALAARRDELTDVKIRRRERPGAEAFHLQQLASHRLRPQAG